LLLLLRLLLLAGMGETGQAIFDDLRQHKVDADRLVIDTTPAGRLAG